MNEAERKKYDEAEASGLLPRLRLVVQSFCAPIWWEIDEPGEAVRTNAALKR